jgi:hypothetical protein
MCKGRIAPPHTPAIQLDRGPGTLTASWSCKKTIENAMSLRAKNGHFYPLLWGTATDPASCPNRQKVGSEVVPVSGAKRFLGDAARFCQDA